MRPKNQSRDPLVLSTHWHIDCRLAAELPDDRVVSSRFLLNLPFGAVALALLVFLGWELSRDFSLRANTADWSRKLADSRVQIATIKQQQRDYTTIAFKIEAAHALMRNRIYVTGFMTQLSRLRPAPMIIDAVETNDAGVVVRGNLTGSAEESTRQVGSYLKLLRDAPGVGPFFDIRLSSFEPTRSDLQNFELSFRYKEEAPP